jgi:hypothetical protein
MANFVGAQWGFDKAWVNVTARVQKILDSGISASANTEDLREHPTDAADVRGIEDFIVDPIQFEKSHKTAIDSAKRIAIHYSASEAAKCQDGAPRLRFAGRPVQEPELPLQCTLADVWKAYPHFDEYARDRVRGNLNNAVRGKDHLTGTVMISGDKVKWYAAQVVRGVVAKEAEKHGK